MFVRHVRGNMQGSVL